LRQIRESYGLGSGRFCQEQSKKGLRANLAEAQTEEHVQELGDWARAKHFDFGCERRIKPTPCVRGLSPARHFDFGCERRIKPAPCVRGLSPAEHSVFGCEQFGSSNETLPETSGGRAPLIPILPFDRLPSQSYCEARLQWTFRFPLSPPNSLLPMRCRFIPVLLASLLAWSARGQTPAPEPSARLNPALPTIFIAGDSTAAVGRGEAQQGWAVPFADYFDPARVNVANRARGGRSSRTFITEGIWENLLKDVKPGDIVLIQFGHNDAGALNDEPPPPLRARGSIPGLGEETREIDNVLTKKHEVVHTFGWYMRKMVAEAKARGASPIVLSTTVRNNWTNGHIERGPGRYRLWSSEIAQAANVPFVDLSNFMADKFEQLGADNTKRLYGQDHTHFNAAGADLHAAAVVAGLKGLSPNPIAHFLSAKGEAVAPARPDPSWQKLPNPADTWVYFGSHRAGPNIGFSRSSFDTDTGELTKPEFVIEARAPAFFVIAPDGRHLYTCNSGTPGGVAAYSIDSHSGRMVFLNRELAGGGDTSYITLDRTGHFALAANYDGGNISVFALTSGGALGDGTAFEQHTGHGLNPQRQGQAHPHSIVIDPTNRFALVPDLGLDKVFVYRFDEKSGSLEPNDPPFASVAPGSGARHIKFHPNGRWAYLITELASTVIAFNWDSGKGTLTEFQTVSTLPEGFKGRSNCSELEIHPNGRFLYGSNRGHDSLAAFSIDPATGRLSLIQIAPSGGKTPRNFAFDPTAKWIVCTNHDSDNAVVFRVDDATGRLTRTGGAVAVPYPFCERFLPVR